jgi:DNA-binding MarR family transcriptional regulator
MQPTPAAENDVHSLLKAYLEAVALVELPRLELQQATGLTIPQFRILRHLREQPRVQSELVQIVGLSPAGVSRLIDRLQDRRLVTSRRRAEDRRQVEVHITSDGLKVLGDISLLGGTALAQAAEGMPPAQRARITAALRELIGEVSARSELSELPPEPS